MLLKAFVDSILSGTEPPCSGRDNISTLALMLAAYDSADEGREINLQDYISNATRNSDID
jgi:predicted dehydrogenase